MAETLLEFVKYLHKLEGRLNEERLDKVRFQMGHQNVRADWLGEQYFGEEHTYN